MNQNNLPTGLRSALAERHPAAVRHLLDHHGLVAFSAALATWSPRVVADVLSLLPQVTALPYCGICLPLCAKTAPASGRCCATLLNLRIACTCTLPLVRRRTE
jgi:hypothetical protein